MIEAHSRYFAPYLGRMRPLPGAADLLEATAGLGLRVVLATSAKDEEIDLMLDALGARDSIGTVVSSGDVEQAKPQPDIVEKALSESGTDPGRAVMVGDAVWDMIAAGRPASRASACSPEASQKRTSGMPARRRSTPTRPTCSARSRLVLSASLLSAPENRACYATRPAPWRRVTARHPTR